ncbi:MAG: hypothetical protein LUG49_06525 [Oscillospiraceae bacterium]|nr:hypothetical protein [Oscillospiraceae bacterium]
MKKLIFVIPTQLSDDGSLKIKNFRSLKVMIGCLKENYSITLLIQTHRDKRISELDELGVSVLYDNSPQKEDTELFPSRFRTSYERWSAREKIVSECECMIAWDGCSPWCLATALTCVNLSSLGAKRKVLWIHDDPELYLMPSDHAFHSDLCNRFDSVISSDEEICKKLKCEAVRLPVDSFWYIEQSEQPCECEFKEDEINLLAVCRMNVESDLETLPARIAELWEQNKPVHCYLIGDGVRLNRYIQQVAIYDVDSEFTFLGAKENPYPYLRAGDALIVSERERTAGIETAAEIFGVPVVPAEQLDQVDSKKEANKENRFAWADEAKLIGMLG